MLTMYNINSRDASGVAKLVREIAGYEGFLSSARFLDDDNVLTGSGDMKVMQFKVETGQKVLDLKGHNGDVAAMSLHPSEEAVFVTGSVDKTVRLWDIRGDQELCQYKPPSPNSSFTSVGVSLSGRILLASSDDSSIHMWDVTGTHVGSLGGHENRITQISVAPAGFAIASASWDQTVRVWGL